MKSITHEEYYFQNFEKYFEFPYPASSDFRNDLEAKLSSYLEFYTSQIIPYFFADIQTPSKVDETGLPIWNDSDKDGSETFHDMMKELNGAIIQVVDLYLDGRLDKAYGLFFSVLDKQFFKDNLPITNRLPTDLYFRFARVHKNEKIDEERIFHVPFEKREHVSNQRYSIAGFPSLYLGENAFVCYKELDIKPQTKRCFVGASFKSIKRIRVFQFLRIRQFMDRYILSSSDEARYIRGYLMTFPLMIACSYKVNNPKGPFKPEYIIPQMLMSYIRQNVEIDGIIYPSTKIVYNDLIDESPYNLVMPVKSSNKSGYCEELRRYFYWSS